MSKKEKTRRDRGPSYEILRAIMSNKLTVLCLVVVLLLVFASLTADIFFDYETDVIGQDPTQTLQPPSAAHWFGTDAYGRDYFARMIYATRTTLIIALSSMVITVALAIALGGSAAYFGGAYDALLMRALDVIMAIPQTLFVICIIAALGNSTFNIILALVISGLAGSVRTARAAFMMAMQNEYVEAAHACGVGKFRIIFGHLLPNSMGPILVTATMGISACILSTASLGYLGLGIPKPAPEWGRMLSEAQEYMRTKFYLLLIPGLFILVTATVFNLLGDGIRDAMDPRLRGSRKPSKRMLKKRRGM